MNLKIWHKMIIGISVPSFIAILGGLLSYGYINDVKNRHGFVQIADDIKEHVLEVRRNEKIFLHYKNTEYFNNLTAAIIVLNNLIDSTSEKTVKEIGREDFSLLRKSIQAYSSLVDKLLKNYQQETEIIEKVREEGRKLETFAATGKHAAEISTSFVLNLRRLEKNYMLFRDKDSFDALNTGISQLRNITPFCYECIPYTETIHNLFTIHEKSDLIIDELQFQGNKLEKITGEIASRERKHISSFFAATQRLLLLTVVLFCTLGPLFVYKTATYIAAPIKRLAEITKKISEGDITLRAPLKEHDETYSLSLSFNTMLDHLQLTHESLEKSLELLHEKQKEVEKCASIGFLVSGVAHELNNPLGIILGFTDIMLEKVPPNSQEQEILKTIERHGIRAKRVVENLLSFARYSEHKEEDVDINKSIISVLSLVSNTLLMNKISLKQHLQDDLPSIKGCDEELQQVFFNITNNAISAMKDGGGLTISTRALNNDIEIRFADTGYGIKKEHRKKIFEPLFTTKKIGEGTGLGLSVSHDIITRLGGTISFETKTKDESEETGTTFVINLPVTTSSLSPS